MKTVATWIIVGFVVLGVLSAIIIKKIVGKIISLVVAAALIFFAWQQRNHVLDYANDVRGHACQAEPHFLGFTVHWPAGWCART